MGVKENIYFDEKIASNFAAQEQSEKGFLVGDMMDQVIIYTINAIDNNFRAAELGGGAHPDRYHRFFDALIANNGIIDRVDNSPYMLELARNYIDNDTYKDRLKVIKFIEKDMIEYLEDTEDNSLDVIIMKYTIDYIERSHLEHFFKLVQKKLKAHGALVSTIGILNPSLKSISTHGRYFYKGEAFPDKETRALTDGDSYSIKFFLKAGNPSSGYIPGAETTKFYHSKEAYKALAEQYGLTLYIGDRKEYVVLKDSNAEQNQNILILKK